MAKRHRQLNFILVNHGMKRWSRERPENIETTILKYEECPCDLDNTNIPILCLNGLCYYQKYAPVLVTPLTFCFCKQ